MMQHITVCMTFISLDVHLLCVTNKKIYGMCMMYYTSRFLTNHSWFHNNVLHCFSLGLHVSHEKKNTVWSFSQTFLSLFTEWWMANPFAPCLNPTCAMIHYLSFISIFFFLLVVLIDVDIIDHLYNPNLFLIISSTNMLFFYLNHSIFALIFC